MIIYYLYKNRVGNQLPTSLNLVARLPSYFDNDFH